MSAAVAIEFNQHTEVDPFCLVQMIQGDPQTYKLGGANQLQFKHKCTQADEKIALINGILDNLKLNESEVA
jgi:transcription-repair coupling factor (superfamily II helicase)